MRRILIRGASAATVLCGLMLGSPAFAGGAGMPWESPLQQIVESVTGPVVQAAAVLAICLFGGGIAMSENGSTVRRGMGRVDLRLVGDLAAVAPPIDHEPHGRSPSPHWMRRS